jgi:hypothetical protein
LRDDFISAVKLAHDKKINYYRAFRRIRPNRKGSGLGGREYAIMRGIAFELGLNPEDVRGCRRTHRHKKNRKSHPIHYDKRVARMGFINNRARVLIKTVGLSRSDALKKANVEYNSLRK